MSGTKTALRALDQVLAELGERRTRGAVLDTDVGGWIGAVEDALREHLSFRIEIPITDVGRQFPESLVFGTLAGTWRLLVHTECPISETSSTVRLISEPPEKQMTLVMDGHLENLLRDAIRQLGEQVVERQ